MSSEVVQRPNRPMKPEEWGFPGWLTPDEEAALKALREKVLKEGLFSKNTLMPDKHLLRFLRARDFDLNKSFIMLRDDLQWRRQFEGVVFKVSDFPSIYNFSVTGALYRAGYDKDGRPVLVTQLAKVFPREISDLSEIPKYWVAYVHYLNDECEKAGVTDYTAIADLGGFSPSKNFSLAMTKTLIEILQKYYPERLAYALVLHTPMAFRMLWNMIAPFLEERTKAKVHILGNDLNLLQNYVPKDQLETVFGGTHKPYPKPDHIAQSFQGDGFLVKTGYFDEDTIRLQSASSPSSPTSSSLTDLEKKKSTIKRGMSSSRLQRVRSILSGFDTMKKEKEMPLAIDVPKSSPRITVFGATGRTGLEVVKKALIANYDVCAFVRIDGSGIPANFLKLQVDYGTDKLQIVVGNIHDSLDLDRAIETSDAVVSCMGAPRSVTEDNEFFETTATDIIAAMERNGTKRLVVVTAAQAKRMSKAWYDANASIVENGNRVMYWQTHYKHIAALEKFIESKNDVIDFTFVRPVQLDDKSTSESYQAEPDTFFIQGGALSRPALAKFIVDECIVKKKYIGQGVAMAAQE